MNPIVYNINAYLYNYKYYDNDVSGSGGL